MAEFNTGQLAKDAAQIGGGFLLGGFIGRKLEDIALSTPVTSTSSFTDKIIAGTVNNASKVALYWLLNKVGQTTIAGAVIGNAVVDVLIRVTNQGVNPVNITVAGYRIMDNNTPIKDNSLRTFSNPEVEAIQRRYSSMPFEQYTDKTKRERQFGFAGKLQDNSPGFSLFNMR